MTVATPEKLRKAVLSSGRSGDRLALVILRGTIARSCSPCLAERELSLAVGDGASMGGMPT